MLVIHFRDPPSSPLIKAQSFLPSPTIEETCKTGEWELREDESHGRGLPHTFEGRLQEDASLQRT